MAVTLALTVGHIDRLIDRINNLGDKNLGAARARRYTTGPLALVTSCSRRNLANNCSR